MKESKENECTHNWGYPVQSPNFSSNDPVGYYYSDKGISKRIN